MLFSAVKQAELAYDVGEYYMIQRSGEMLVSGLNLWVDPRDYLNGETEMLLDVSGFERHRTLNSDYANVWQTASEPYFLRFDGTNDQSAHGNVLNDDASGDFMVEGWLRVQGADASVQEVLAKKTDLTGDGAGWGIYRGGANVLTFKISYGTSSVTMSTAGTYTQNAWAHFAFTVDRNGNIQGYKNGVASGTPANVAALTTATNSATFNLGRDGTNFGQRFGAGFVGCA